MSTAKPTPPLLVSTRRFSVTLLQSDSALVDKEAVRMATQTPQGTVTFKGIDGIIPGKEYVVKLVRTTPGIFSDYESVVAQTHPFIVGEMAAAPVQPTLAEKYFHGLAMLSTEEELRREANRHCEACKAQELAYKKEIASLRAKLGWCANDATLRILNKPVIKYGVPAVLVLGGGTAGVLYVYGPQLAGTGDTSTEMLSILVSDLVA